MKFEILGHGGGILFFVDAPTIKLAVESAVEENANLRDANLGGAYLRDANLGSASLSRANLSDAYLSDAYLRDAYLRDANLSGANLSRANLSDANLSDANLSRANLSDANLSRANLSDANLCDANLCGANLRGAKLRGAFLEHEGKKLTLVGARPVLQITPIGSRDDTLLAFITDGGAYVRSGCFFNTLTEFAAAVKAEHGDNAHAEEYAVAISLIELHERRRTVGAHKAPG